MAATQLPTVRRLVGRKNKLAEEYETLNAQCVAPDADQLDNVQDLLADEDFNPTDETTRLRLRSAIARIVKAIWLLKAGSRFKPRYLAQIDFKNGASRLIWWGDGLQTTTLVPEGLAQRPLEMFRDDPDWFLDRLNILLIPTL
jgi:hypothetical protein